MDPLPVDLPGPRRPVDVAVLVRCTTALLRAGVPLTLLLDLSDEQGPHSEERYAAEGGDAGWLLRPSPS